MPAGGVGCSPLPCLRRLFTHDDDDSGGGDGDDGDDGWSTLSVGYIQ